jgi:hypothetical protein
MGKMITIKYGWDLVRGKFERVYKESFKTEEQAVKWTNSYLQELGEEAEQYETLTDIEKDVYSVFGDTGAEIERA